MMAELMLFERLLLIISAFKVIRLIFAMLFPVNGTLNLIFK